MVRRFVKQICFKPGVKKLRDNKCDEPTEKDGVTCRRKANQKQNDLDEDDGKMIPQTIIYEAYRQER